MRNTRVKNEWQRIEKLSSQQNTQSSSCWFSRYRILSAFKLFNWHIKRNVLIPRTLLLHFPHHIVFLFSSGHSVGGGWIDWNSMAPSLNNSVYNDTIQKHWKPLSPSQCVPWFAVFSTECLTVVILNLLTIIVFMKQRQLQRQSKFLIIHQAIVDLLVGLVYGPLMTEWSGSFNCDLWDYHRPDVTLLLLLELVLGLQVYQVSLLNLAVISLERVHATFRPFKHRFIKKWVYGVIITIVWLVPSVINLFIITHSYDFLRLISFAYFFTLLFVVVVCYISIYLKVLCSRHLQHHGVTGLRERKLTNTSFIITLGSLITFLPMVVFWGVLASDSKLFDNLSNQSSFHFEMVKIIFVAANSLINPIIYAIRMPELRAGIMQIIFRRALNPNYPIDIPIQNI